jgi:hypothetical protein
VEVEDITEVVAVVVEDILEVVVVVLRTLKRLWSWWCRTLQIW